MARKALIVRGGWDGHQPVEVSELFREILVNEGFEVEISETLDSFLDVEKLKALISLFLYGQWVRSLENKFSRCLRQ